ncbi:major head protein [Alteromonas phage vB_AmaP_AD45-P1]|uniref:major head protein n=1 Tax=Alteromonas phage vB_AmaP_AD45-P1 TaxID=1300004 RepID=UPI0003334DDD|nr:major head protein [Alteromonas phage vB_AmaP_AD45-P1]AGM46828.1 major coat protein [Alteromonas phage vB_AmaP_AD45-P1]
MPTTNVYGNGTNSTAGANTIVHFYDRAGVKAANRTNVYGQFADRKSMPKKMGKTFKISKFLHMYDRALNDAEFSAKGFLSARDIDQVNTALNDASLAEGAGAVNKRSLKKITMETSLARYGEMIDYTDEVELFSEDAIQVRYREELGELANSRMEDLMQLDMLATPTVMYGGSATAIGEVDADSTVSYDLIRKGVRKLVRNRAQKNTQMVTGDVKVDTRTVAKSYYAVIGANVKGDLETLTRGTVADNGTTEFVYIPAHKYGSAATLAEGEVGAMHEVRFIESESAVVYAGQGADLLAILVTCQ